MLIFLDIDGVMVPAKSWTRPDLLSDGFAAFSTNATKVLQRLISADTTVILTTSHKSNYSIEEWKGIFKVRGIIIDKLSCLPANTGNLSRKEEIMNWLGLNKGNERYIIVDDDKSLNDLPAMLKDNLIQTSSHIGLTEEHLEIARAMMNR